MGDCDRPPLNCRFPCTRVWSVWTPGIWVLWFAYTGTFATRTQADRFRRYYHGNSAGIIIITVIMMVQCPGLITLYYMLIQFWPRACSQMNIWPRLSVFTQFFNLSKCPCDQTSETFWKRGVAVENHKVYSFMKLTFSMTQMNYFFKICKI